MNPAHLDLSRRPASATTIQRLDVCVPAGFPSPADDHMVQRCDLVALLSTHPQATYFLRVRGDSMVGAGIQDQDIVAVDRAITPRHGHTVVARVDNEFTCKTLFQRDGQVRLVAANAAYPDIRLRDGQSLEIWGVVTAALTLFRT